MLKFKDTTFMLTTVEAEIDVNGSVTLLEPLTLTKKSRAIITVLDGVPTTRHDEPADNRAEPDAKPMPTPEAAEPSTEEQWNAYNRRREWFKANRERYGGQYVVLDGDRFLGVAKNYPEGVAIAKKAGVFNAFIDYLSKPDEMGFMSSWS
jgi:hypothetical protein